MDIFTFEFVPYIRNLKGRLRYPVGRQHFDAEVASQSYHNVVEQCLACEEAGFDGFSLNEHHGSPYGLDNSPNLFLAYLARATSRIKLTMLGNLLPIHGHPLRVAEELAMLDVITRGRIIAGFARGIPREYLVYNAPLGESKARFDESLDVIVNAWTSDLFTHHGQYYHYDQVDMWPRPHQQPHPPVWVAAISDETTRMVARKGFTLCVNFLTTAEVKRQLQVFREAWAELGRPAADAEIVYGRHVFVADSQAEAERLCKPYIEYYFQNLLEEINFAALERIRAQNPGVNVDPPFDYRTATMENLRERGLLLVGTPDRVFSDLMEQYQEVGGFGTLLAMIRMGDMPQEVVLRSIQLMGDALIPKLHALGVPVGAPA